MKPSSAFAKFAWFNLAYNLFVILWGAYVRASGSGAGCGSHWPLCNGVVVPRAPQIETLVEFTHRLSSGLALVLVLVLAFWAWRIYPRGHRVRRGAGFSVFFMVTEALVGAGLVLFEWVAHDQSLGRVISMGVHLVNTFLLLACITLTAWWASGGPALDLHRSDSRKAWFIVAFLAMLVLGVSGAITALGDTLFPAGSLAAGIAEDFNEEAHFLVRLRVWHPILAILVGTYLFLLAALTAMFSDEKVVKRIAYALIGLFLVQLLAGLVNLILLAPIWMQIVHLLLADLVWITLVLLAAVTFARQPAAGVEVTTETQAAYA